MKEERCNCGSGVLYSSCCEVFHRGKEKAITAEQLMRSRYTAFTKADGGYLMRSHHSKTRPIHEKKEIVSWAKSVEWIRLEVLKISLGLENDTEGMVEFKAYFFENGVVQVIHEKSKFLRENGNWVYYGRM